MPFSKEVESAIRQAAERYGLEPDWLRTIAQVESSGNPKASSGSYSGLFQLSPDEFKRVGGKGDILDPKDNAMAAASLLKSHVNTFQEKFGRAPEAAELYMIHQQGFGGFQKHLENPDRPAWENMAETKEGQARGEEWAKKAISGNLSAADKKKFGEDLTSGQFMEAWKGRIQGIMGPLPRPVSEATPQPLETPERGFQGEVSGAWPSAGERIGGAFADILQKGTGLSRDWAGQAAAPVGTVGEMLAGPGQEVGRAIGRFATEPSRETAGKLGLELGMAVPPGRLVGAGKVGIAAGKTLRDVVGQQAVKKSPELPEGMRFEEVLGGPKGKKRFEIRKGDERVGSVDLDKEPGKPAYINMVFVKPEYRGQGIANKLYDHIEQRLGERLAPSRTLLPPGYSLWQGRDPKAVTGYKPRVSEGKVYGWNPRWAPYDRPEDYGIGPGRQIPGYHGQPVDPSALRYPEYPGRDPFEKIRVTRPIITYHGSPHDFPAEKIEDEIYPLGRFRWEKIGTGEGVQAQGKGHYAAEAEAVGKGYRDALSELKIGGGVYDLDDPLHVAAAEVHHRRGDTSKAIKNLEFYAAGVENKFQRELFKQAAWALRQGKELPKVTTGGKMYELAIHADPDHFIDLDKPVSEQSEFVQAAFRGLGLDIDKPAMLSGQPLLGSEAIGRLSIQLGLKSGKPVETTSEEVSQALRKVGIPGMRYFDLGSRKEGQGTRNYVVLNEHTMEILRKYGLLPPVAAGALGAAMSRPEAETETEPEPQL